LATVTVNSGGSTTIAPGAWAPNSKTDVNHIT
jgi:hypothetical protein